MKKILIVTFLAFVIFSFPSYIEVLASDSGNNELTLFYEDAKLEIVDISINSEVEISNKEKEKRYDFGFDFSEVQDSLDAYNAIVSYGDSFGLDFDLDYTLFNLFCEELFHDYDFIINSYIYQINAIINGSSSINNSDLLDSEKSYIIDQDVFNGSIDSSSSSSSSGDQAWYYNTGTELPQAANYSSNNLLAVAKKGDVLYEAAGFFGLTGHSAIVEGKFYSTSQNQYYIRIIEAISPGGVSRSVLDCTRLVDREGSLYRVSGATTEDIDNAVSFAISQLGKDYFLDLAKDTSSTEANWYCSELVWAAYKNQGIDIEVSGSKDKSPGIWPIDIVNDDETYYLILTPTPSC